jgi:hypothetical protein
MTHASTASWSATVAHKSAVPGGLAGVVGPLAALLCACAVPAWGAPTGPSVPTLQTLAATAARQHPVSPLRRGQQRLLRWRGTTLLTLVGARGAYSRLEYRTSEEWVRPDGSGQWRSVCSASVPVGPRDRARWRQAGSPRDAICTKDGGRTGPGGLLSAVPLADEVEALPNEPAPLEARLRAAARPSRRRLDDGEMFALMAALLRVPDAPPQLRAGLLLVLARLAGVEPLTPVTDPLGRRGLAVALRDGSLRHELILAPQSTGVLAERTVTERRLDWADARPGGVLGWVAYSESAAVGPSPVGSQ